MAEKQPELSEWFCFLGVTAVICLAAMVLVMLSPPPAPVIRPVSSVPIHQKPARQRTTRTYSPPVSLRPRSSRVPSWVQNPGVDTYPSSREREYRMLERANDDARAIGAIGDDEWQRTRQSNRIMYGR